MKFSLDDICIVPAVVSDINHRIECNPYNEDNMLPLFTAPMSSVIDENNYDVFLNNKINTIIPRHVDINIRKSLMTKTFVAMGLEEFHLFINESTDIDWEITKYICVDIANGHMRKLLDLCKLAKDKYGGNLVLMAGNIANPATYSEYAKVGIDLIRCSVGNGSACITASNAACFYPMGSLLQEINEVKKFVEARIKFDKLNNLDCEYKSVPMIIADGGFNSFDRIIKALALGADYVMIGKLFAQTKEACGKVTNGMRDYYGMSTKRAQSLIGTSSKTSEGIEFKVSVEYTLASWIDNFISYLRSAMSYTNSKNLEDFKKVEICQITSLARNSYYK